VVRLPNVRVVEAEFLTRADPTSGVDVNTAFLDSGLAVGIARVVDEFRAVATHAGVDHHIGCDLEEHRVMRLSRESRWIATLEFCLGDAFTRVVDDPLSRIDASRRERAAARDA